MDRNPETNEFFLLHKNGFSKHSRLKYVSSLGVRGDNMGEIISLSVGKPKDFMWKGKSESSGIGKGKVSIAELTKDGFVGDGVASIEYHGGPERAVCVYSYEHYQQWEKEFNVKLSPPSLGENLCVTGMLEKDVYIGDVYSLGNAVVQVTQGRVPCSKISKFNEIDLFLKRIVETNYTGYFFKVLQEGKVHSEGKLELLDRTQEKVSILYANQIFLHDKKNRAGLKDLLEVDELADVWRQNIEKLLAKTI
jgi:MOSC domain-containing protein YiiM